MGSQIGSEFLDGNSYADLVGNGGTGVMLSSGSATMGLVQTYRPGLTYAAHFAIGDVDRDDVLDIVVAGDRTGELRVLYGQKETP